MRKIHETVHVGVDIHSRLVMPPMVTEASIGGEISEKTLAYYKKMAANKQFDLFIIEHSYVSEDGKASLKQMSLADDEKIAGHRKLVAAIKSVRPDAAVFLQLNHAGIKTRADIIGADPMGPSVRPWDKMCRAMSLEDMARVKADFVAAALRAKKAGYDGAELHVAHGYLLNQFLSPLTNFRDDDYGEDRVKYPLEVFRAMKEALGDFPLAVRIGGIETIAGGTTVDDGVRAAKAFDAAGAAFLDMTGGMTGDNRPGHEEAGWFQDLSRAVKKETTAPVLLTGGITTYDEAEKLLAEDAADLFGIGRAFLKDPNWETDKL
ncbi:MAG: NADH:flavin oxidoreductase [Peptoniphilaceae bacterium]